MSRKEGSRPMGLARISSRLGYEGSSEVTDDLDGKRIFDARA